MIQKIEDAATFSFMVIFAAGIFVYYFVRLIFGLEDEEWDDEVDPCGY